MEWLQVLVLAAIQGLTEFLPISSSAHLILVPVLTDWPDQGLAFDVAVHVGSLAAVLVYFRAEFTTMLREGLGPIFLRFAKRGRGDVGSGKANASQGAQAYLPVRRAPGPRSTQSIPADPRPQPRIGDISGLGRPRDAARHDRLLLLVVVATIPVGAAGLAVDASLSESLRNPLVIAAATIGFGLVLLVAERAGAKDRRLGSVGIRDAIVIGCAQALALVPGTSRSGITMTAGLLVGLTPAASVRFSFLLSAPVILMAGGYKALQLASVASDAQWSALVLGALVAALCAYACIHAFLGLVSRIGFAPFVAYRLVLGGVLIWLFV